MTSWDDQLHLFKSALSSPPNKSIDIVAANAGISGPDPLFTMEGRSNAIFDVVASLKGRVNSSPGQIPKSR